MKGDKHFDWEGLVPRIVHPMRVTIIEAIEWVGVPLSAADLTKVIDDEEEVGISHLSYHLNRLGEVGCLKLVRRRQARGSIEKFYFLP